MPPVYPGAFNTYVPMAVASLQSNYSQNPSMFSVNQYATVAQVSAMTGYYNVHDPAPESEIILANMADSTWYDGAYPQVTFAKGNNFVQYTCKRYHQMFTIGDLAAQQASWNVLADYSQSAAMNLMVRRTYNVLATLTNTANWTVNTDTATNIGGGYWSAGTSSAPYIRKSIQAAIVAIQKATNATVSAQNLYLIISPETAFAMSQSQEIIDYFKQSYVAKESIEQTPGSGFLYGIPDPLYGVRTIVEDRVYNSAAKGAAPVNSYILGKQAILVSRPGSLMGSMNTMSTCTLAMYQDMGMVTEHKTTAMLTEGVLFDNYDTIIRPQSGYLITAVLA